MEYSMLVPAATVFVLVLCTSATANDLQGNPSRKLHDHFQFSNGEWIDCKDGFSNGTKCENACGGMCCSGDYACEGFTGRLYKDNDHPSCIGDRACNHANISSVVDSCQGPYACAFAGDSGGSLGMLESACWGNKACMFAAYAGVINEISKSCRNKTACNEAGSYGGGIAGIEDACNGVNSCFHAGMSVNHTISSVMSSCCNQNEECEDASEVSLPRDCSDSLVPTKEPTSSQVDRKWIDCEDGFSDGQSCEDACDGLCCKEYLACEGFTGKLYKSKDDPSCSGTLACYYAKINSVKDSCKGSYACAFAGGSGGSLGMLESACWGDLPCMNIAYNGSIHLLFNSCKNGGSCAEIGSYGGSIDGIYHSCNGVNSCVHAGKFANHTFSVMFDCCNRDSECEDASEASLPGACTYVFTEPPSTSPTNTPTVGN